METIYYILLATFFVSMVSFAGVFFGSRFIQKILKYMLSFAAGALFAAAFFEILPEAADTIDIRTSLFWALGGIVMFLVLDRFIFWYHCHKTGCKVHTFTYLNLIGDGLHNFIDGMVISAAFITNIALGVTTTIAVIFHEIPQEIGDYSILIYGGFKKKIALLFNFLSALTAIIGALVVYYLPFDIKLFSGYLLAIAAGGFIYIAGSDLIPEIHKEEKLRASVIQFIAFLFGIIIIASTGMILGG